MNPTYIVKEKKHSSSKSHGFINLPLKFRFSNLDLVTHVETLPQNATWPWILGACGIAIATIIFVPNWSIITNIGEWYSITGEIIGVEKQIEEDIVSYTRAIAQYEELIKSNSDHISIKDRVLSFPKEGLTPSDLSKTIKGAYIDLHTQFNKITPYYLHYSDLEKKLSAIDPRYESGNLEIYRTTLDALTKRIVRYPTLMAMPSCPKLGS